jgi:hypothetical protein
MSVLLGFSKNLFLGAAVIGIRRLKWIWMTTKQERISIEMTGTRKND